MNDAPTNPHPPQRRPQGDRPKKRDVNGWIILDKGVGMTSTHAVAVVKRGLSAKKAGHAGTLDPLASGILPIALGEATKTVPFIMDGRKSYVFTVAWGEETNTDDAEGEVVGRTDLLPEAAAIEALLPRFIGQVQQVPPRFSAIKIQGERAYDLARDGEVVELQPRTVEIDRIALVHHRGNRSVLEADCGKGTYVRAIARDLGRALGCLGHIAALRRTRVGPFTEADAVTVDDLTTDAAALRPVESALHDIPSIAVSRDMAGRLMRGQSIILRGRDAPISGKIFATCNGVLVAVGDVEKGELVPHRVFNLGA
ncbi:tRNA pseudouridine(55) synthase TruB [Microvirga antarctica]|uniref:tRNA pseudouridine(55) synthase TruB n=1 Tax=Microvirga antarctica TaxID=2819233 RepID=UPI001B3035CF|nr:tRNA pseudouridine(55) synthase TruB [Microvirga antarctica]